MTQDQHRVIRLAAPAEMNASTVTELSVAAGSAIGRSPAGSSVCLVVDVPVEPREVRSGLREALRSIVHSSVRERPSVRVNLVFGGNGEDQRRTVDFVADSPFTFGAIVDLGAPS